MPKRLNLIRPEESDIKYKIVKFPDGEPHLVFEEELDRKDSISVIYRICNPNDLFILMQIGDVLNRQEIEFDLNILYLMSMRMDRVISFEEPYSLKIVAGVINSIKPSSVQVLEPHSSKIQQLIEEYWGNLQIDKPVFENYITCLPDNGAVERMGQGASTLICSKVRDTSTGKLSGFTIENPQVLKEFPKWGIVVVDDLCDGGGTFAGIAKEIRKVDKDRKLCIYVTHIVNSKGIKTLSENYDEVYFTNSYKDWQKEKLPDNVTVIEVV